MVFAREPKFRPKTRTTTCQKKYNGSSRRANVRRKNKDMPLKNFESRPWGTKVVPFSKNGVKKPIHPLGKQFLHRSLERRKWQIKKRKCSEKMAITSRKMLLKWIKTHKHKTHNNGKNRENLAEKKKTRPSPPPSLSLGTPSSQSITTTDCAHQYYTKGI